jgi:hypothetical protein
MILQQGSFHSPAAADPVQISRALMTEQLDLQSPIDRQARENMSRRSAPGKSNSLVHKDTQFWRSKMR